VCMSIVVSGQRKPSHRKHRIGSLFSETLGDNMYQAYDRLKQSPIGETAIEERRG